MDALIRHAQLASIRTRLSAAHAGRIDAALEEGALHSPQATPHALRDEIERQVRSELTEQMQRLYESERTRACEAGLAAAVAEAKAAAAEELTNSRRELEARVDSALAAMAVAHRSALAQLASSVGEVAFAAVCKLLGRQAPSREFVLSLMEQTCAELRADVTATARLHPRDIRTLGELLKDQELRLHSIGLKVIPDESLRLGGCFIEAASGQYDGGLECQLIRLHAVLTGDAVTAHAGAAESAAMRTLTE
jgi:flagellar assembly protein FliH